ncbi:tRNA (guanosine(37)-N1)-methyltransferase TrmD [Nitrosophilus alvini]|uniref:tRNA (guanosine(37)-N1)-methyltransferase TrmD n=1 Tax=Nitrosophilus alvini TaxID=2714855 RepID=UPI00190A7A05|nr:tRNA (guanosine(37)-N1)-methyltransferase TrmD [Nitrosophilus alvini]
MRFTFVTLFKNLIDFYFEDSILKRAKANGLIKIDFVNPREFSKERHKKVDHYKAGGGAGMLMTPQPLCDAIESVKEKKSWVVFLTPAAKRFNQKDAKRLSKKEHIIFVTGRYEGFDERVVEIEADEVFSIGDFVLTGGELAALAMCDAISRNIEGVLGNISSLEEESFEENLLEAPAFCKPVEFRGSFIPSELLKGNHSKISALKYRMSLCKTKFYRPDLLRDSTIKDIK